MTRDAVLVVLFAFAPICLVLIVALLRGYTVIVQFIRRDKRNGE